MQSYFLINFSSLAGPHQLPSYDPINTLIFASSGRDVVLTVVAGREVFSAGTVTTIDEERLAARMKEIAVQLGAQLVNRLQGWGNGLV